MYRYFFEKKALKAFKKLPAEIQERILKKLDFFVSSPNPLAFAEYLINFNLGMYRFRVGDWRIIFDVEGEEIVILAVGHRREIYK